MAAMKTSQHYKQIIDLEYFLHRDSETAASELKKRDRDIFLRLEEKQSVDIATAYSSQKLYRWWLKQRKQMEADESPSKSPGEIFQDTLSLAYFLAVLKGSLIGAISGLVFFTYTGTTPVNVFLFLLLFIGSQLILTSLWLLASFAKKIFPAFRRPSFYTSLILSALSRLNAVVHKQWINRVDARKRTSANHVFGIIKARKSVFGSLFYWPLFNLSQLFGIGFNCGLLAIMLLKVSTTDLAFGWQSTIQLSNHAIHKTVHAISLPWSFLVEGGSPTLAEIEGSRIILKDGIYNLTTPDLVSWWPFLVLCLITYGLLLRLILFGAGKMMERFRLKRFTPATPPYLALLRRMKTPIVSTQAPPEQNQVEQQTGNEEIKQKVLQTSALLSPQLLFIADDIFDNCPQLELISHLEALGFSAFETHRFQESYEQDQQLKSKIGDYNWQGEEGIFIVMEGWMVPLMDFLTYLSEIRELSAENTTITVALVGRPSSTIFTSVEENEMHIWKQKIEALGDPYLHLISLVDDSRRPKNS